MPLFRHPCKHQIVHGPEVAGTLCLGRAPWVGAVGRCLGWVPWVGALDGCLGLVP